MKALIFLLFVCLPSLSNALTWGELEDELLSVEAGNPPDVTMIQRLSDIVEAIVHYHVMLRESGVEQTLFCPPGGQEMGLEELASMVRYQARQEQSVDEVMVQRLLLNALQREFACD